MSKEQLVIMRQRNVNIGIGLFVIFSGLVGIRGMLAEPVMAGTSAIGRAGAHIVVPLRISSSTTLQFGVLQTKKQSGTVIVTTDNQRFTTGGIRIVEPSAFSRAEFVITGAPHTAYTIQSLQATAHHPSHQGKSGRVTLEIVDLKSKSLTVGMETPTGQIGSQGFDRVYVGGTLVVPPAAKSGQYEGTVMMTVSY